MTGPAQSITPITLAGADINGIDFGYNFDTIVNTNDSGQGSLRQFILNSNLLGNTGLDQDLAAAIDGDYAAEDEVSIFMIPAADLNGTGGDAGSAVITPTTELPDLTDASTKIDGRTQTHNIGDNNAGTVNSGFTAGVQAVAVAAVEKPEVVILSLIHI